MEFRILKIRNHYLVKIWQWIQLTIIVGLLVAMTGGKGGARHSYFIQNDFPIWAYVLNSIVILILSIMWFNSFLSESGSNKLLKVDDLRIQIINKWTTRTVVTFDRGESIVIRPDHSKWSLDISGQVWVAENLPHKKKTKIYFIVPSSESDALRRVLGTITEENVGDFRHNKI